MLRIYNTLTREKDEFKPIEAGRVGMYVCGMTVYDYCHLGHARVLVSFDVVVRYLRSQGYAVTYVRNITDIDDKIINRAAENGESVDSLTGRFIEAMHEDERALNVLPPNIEPRATQFVPPIIDMVQKLIDSGHAYVGDNHDVYYDVSSFEGYGRLSNKRLADLRAGAVWRWMNSRTTRWTSCCGKRPNPVSRLGLALGPGPPWLAHRVLGDVHAISGEHLRYTRRRHGPAVSAPR